MVLETKPIMTLEEHLERIRLFVNEIEKWMDIGKSEINDVLLRSLIEVVVRDFMRDINEIINEIKMGVVSLSILSRLYKQIGMINVAISYLSEGSRNIIGSMLIGIESELETLLQDSINVKKVFMKWG